MSATDISAIIRELVPAQEDIKAGNYEKAALDLITVLGPVIGIGWAMNSTDPTTQIAASVGGFIIGAAAKWWAINAQNNAASVYKTLLELADAIDDRYLGDTLMPDEEEEAPYTQYKDFPGVLYVTENGVDKAVIDVPVAKAAGLKQVDDGNFANTLVTVNRATGDQEKQGYWNPYDGLMHNMVGVPDAFSEYDAGPSRSDLIEQVRAAQNPIDEALKLCGNPLEMKYKLAFGLSYKNEMDKLYSADPKVKASAYDFAYNKLVNVNGTLCNGLDVMLQGLEANMPRDLQVQTAVAAFDEFY